MKKSTPANARKLRKDPGGDVVLRIIVSPLINDWLKELARYVVFGTNPTAVAERFVRVGVSQELRGDGLLRSPPPKPRRRA